ncbi:MAG: galactose oxidase [Pseudomonadota bacterium]
MNIFQTFAVFFFFLFSLTGYSEDIELIGKLNHPIANNAVAHIKTQDDLILYSFNGLKSAKDWKAVSNLVMSFSIKQQKSQTLSHVPWKEGRLASIAATAGGNIYIFGGYTVAENHEEKSMPDVHQLIPSTNTIKKISDMPIPVDDSIALVYQDRYIYLVSGWHDTGNVKDVQIFDTQTFEWHKATTFPGTPVFGHAGGIIKNELLVVDGVKVAAVVDGKRQFKISNEAWHGTIDLKDIKKITWKKIPSHPGPARYRSAAAAYNNKIVFIGGSDNPYNFNGIGYNGKPSSPLGSILSWDMKKQKWQKHLKVTTNSMDHRGLIIDGDDGYILGGMLERQAVSDQVLKFDLLNLD